MSILIDRFYHHIDELRNRIGERRLSKSTGRMKWPTHGVYFFFEEGEYRSNSQELRVVRVGTHAVSLGSQSRLWDRLRAHRGSISSGGGNHRGSIFRLHMGTAFVNKEGLNEQYPTWGIGSSAPKEIREKEHPLEKKVSDYIGNMPFLWLRVKDKASKNSMRAYIESHSIALLSNYEKDLSDSLDIPSGNWLGSYCINPFVRRSGLWNVNYVREHNIDESFLDILEEKVSEM